MLIHDTKEALRACLADKRQVSSPYTAWRREVLKCLETTVIVKADNVAQFIRENKGAAKIGWPQATPFSPYTWVEYEGDPDNPDDAVQIYGVLIISTELPDEEWDVRGRWLLQSSLFVKPKKGVSKSPVVASPYYILTTLNKDGKWDSPVEFYSVTTKEQLKLDRADEEDYQDKMADAASLAVALMTFCFAHCRNVEKIEHSTTWFKKNKRTLLKQYGGEVKYQTILIEPLKKKTEDAPPPESGQFERALHICRGHFKTFDPGHGLFGKYVGTYWWGQQIRGNHSSGVIVSDYSTARLA